MATMCSCCRHGSNVVSTTADSYNVIIVVGTDAIGFNVVIEGTDANSFNVIIVSTYADGYNVVIVVVTDADGQHCQGQTGAAGQAQEGGQGG